MEKENKTRLRELLIDSLAYKISLAEESLAMMHAISQYWNTFDRDNLDYYFGANYSAHFTRFTLSLTELFEKSEKKCDSINLHKALDYICAFFSEAAIEQKTQLAKQFSQKDFKLNVLLKLTDQEFMNLMVSYFSGILPTGQKTGDERLEKILGSVVIQRDKYFASKGKYGLVQLPANFLNECRELLNQAKFFVGVFSMAFLDTVFATDGKEFVLPNDVKVLNTAFLKLLKKEGIIK